MCFCVFFFFNDTATTEIYTLSLHDALPISAFTKQVRAAARCHQLRRSGPAPPSPPERKRELRFTLSNRETRRSEEHTSELQSRSDLVCRLLLEKKKKPPRRATARHC